jgi:hypothetical protein
MFDSPANPDWPLAHLAKAVRSGEGMYYVFDVLENGIDPAVAQLRTVSQMLGRDLARHLQVRHLRVDWISAATVTVQFDPAHPGPVVGVRCQVRIIDDRGTHHTSTRNGSTTIPARPSLGVAFGKIRRLFAKQRNS